MISHPSHSDMNSERNSPTGPGTIAISVVVTTFNRSALLTLCLESLFSQRLQSAEFEIVVVDDCSTDGTNDILRSVHAPCAFTIIRQAVNSGQAASKNAGAQAARGNILLFLDDDMQSDSALLATHLKVHAATNKDRLVFGPIRTRHGVSDEFASTALGESLDVKFDRLLSRSELRWPDDASVMPNSSLSRSLFLAHGGFDQIGFPRRREDEELGVRLWKANVPFVFEPHASAWHSWQKTSHQVHIDWREGGAALVRLYKKHPELIGTRPIFKRFLGFSSVERTVVLLMARYPSAASLLLRAMSASAKLLGERFRKASDEIQSKHRALLSLVGALEEAGGWQAFHRMFGSTGSASNRQNKIY